MERQENTVIFQAHRVFGLPLLGSPTGGGLLQQIIFWEVLSYQAKNMARLKGSVCKYQGFASSFSFNFKQRPGAILPILGNTTWKGPKTNRREKNASQISTHSF